MKQPGGKGLFAVIFTLLFISCNHPAYGQRQHPAKRPRLSDHRVSDHLSLLQSMRLGCELPGVHLDLVSKPPVYPPWQPSEHIQLSVGGRSVLLRQFNELRGYVHILDAPSALRFARLLTSPKTWFLWERSEYAVEIVQAKDALTLPNFGLNDHPLILHAPQDRDTLEYKYPLVTTAWRYDPRVRKMELVRSLFENARYSETILQTMTSPDLSILGDGSMGILTQAAYQKGGFSPAAVRVVAGGFHIMRWLFVQDHSGQQVNERVEQVEELIGSHGEYRRTVVRTVAPLQTRFFLPPVPWIDESDMPTLAITRDFGPQTIQEMVRKHGIDPDVYLRWRLAGYCPEANEAAANGIQLLHLLQHPDGADPNEANKTWVGRRVAFYGFYGGLDGPYRLQVGDGMYVDVEFDPVLSKRAWPIILESSIVGTVQSIDTKHKTIHIRANFKDWHLLGTG